MYGKINQEKLTQVINDITYEGLYKDKNKRLPSITDLGNGMWRIDTGSNILDCGEGFMRDFDNAMKEKGITFINNLNNNKMETEVKELRVRIDGLSQLVKELKPIKDFEPSYRDQDTATIGQVYKTAGNVLFTTMNSPQLDKCYDSLILSKAWLGKVLGSLNVPSPYTNDGKRKDVKDIEPTADKASVIPTKSMIIDKSNGEADDKDWSSLNHIEKVDWLREQVKQVIDQLNEMHDLHDTIDSDNVYTYLSEARFWLGFEMERLHNEHKENNK